MRYLNAAIVGVLSGLLVAALWVFLPSLLKALTNKSGLGATAGSAASILLAWLVGFVAAFAWMLRRT